MEDSLRSVPPIRRAHRFLCEAWLGRLWRVCFLNYSHVLDKMLWTLVLMLVYFNTQSTVSSEVCYWEVSGGDQLVTTVAECPCPLCGRVDSWEDFIGRWVCTKGVNIILGLVMLGEIKTFITYNDYYLFGIAKHQQCPQKPMRILMAYFSWNDSFSVVKLVLWGFFGFISVGVKFVINSSFLLIIIN